MNENHAKPGFNESLTNYSNKPVLSAKNNDDKNEYKAYVIELNETKYTNSIDYDPYLHRDVEHPTTNAETFFHLLKGSVGTGILSMPLAFYHAGYIFGIIGTLTIGAICTYCLQMLIRAEYELCKKTKVPSLSYTKTAETCLLEGPKPLRRFASHAVHIVNMFLLIYQLGACCIYTVFIADNIKDVADYYIGEWDIKIWMLFCLVPLILINYIRNLKYLAPFSTIANCITIGSFGIILFYISKQDITFEDKEPIGHPINYPLFLGTVLFSLEAIGVIMPLENEMKTPKAFKGLFGVLNISMVFIVILYAGMGLIGYLAYGSNVKETITLNISQSDIPAQIAKILLAIAIYITHPLQMYVAIDIVWNQYIPLIFKSLSRPLLCEYVLRTGLVFFTFALAVAVPRLDLFISLVGTFCLSALGLAVPSIIDTCTFWHTFKGFGGALRLIKNSLLVVFGIIALLIGTYTSLKNIIDSFK